MSRTQAAFPEPGIGAGSSRQEAEEAARRIDQVPEAKRWFRHIAESRGLRHAEVAHEELFGLGYLDPG